jgi:hypothetical protein
MDGQWSHLVSTLPEQAAAFMHCTVCLYELNIRWSVTQSDFTGMSAETPSLDAGSIRRDAFGMILPTVLFRVLTNIHGIPKPLPSFSNFERGPRPQLFIQL